MPPPRRSPVPPDRCTLARAFELVGDRWTLLILRSALYGVRRFDDLQAELDIPRTVLSDRLTKLQSNGLIEKSVYRDPGQRPRSEYRLTEKGRDIWLPFMAMAEWGDRWIRNGERPMWLASRKTGDRLRVAMVDGDGRAVDAAEVEVVIAVSASDPPPVD